MEERIRREKGVSITWEAGGGLWKTLKGVYPSQQNEKKRQMHIKGVYIVKEEENARP